jgi:hypothetical protein
MDRVSDRPEYVLTFAAGPDPLASVTGQTREPAYRLRGLLKVARRSFGLRCVRIAPARELGSTDNLANNTPEGPPA